MSKPGRLTVVLGALALALAARAADPAIAFEKYRLPNGLTVILSQDHRLPQVAVNVWYHVGAANQAPGRSGFAHLFEHMMFSGSKHVQPSPFKVLEGIGGVANGSTGFDRTNYYEVVPSNELATALWLESDRIGFLLDTLDARKLQVQRDVVLERAAAELREPPLRADPPADLRPALPVAAPLLPVRHRLHPGDPGGQPRGRASRSSASSTGRRTPRWPSSATSTRPRPGCWWSGTSAPSRPARRCRAPRCRSPG